MVREAIKAFPIILKSTGEPLTRRIVIEEQRRIAEVRLFRDSIESYPVLDKDATEDAIKDLSRYKRLGMTYEHVRFFRQAVDIFAHGYYGGDINQQIANSTAILEMLQGVQGLRKRR